MSRTAVAPTLYDPIGPFGHAALAGVFVSGRPGGDPATGQLAVPAVYEQTVQAIREVLALVGAALTDER